MLDETLIRCIDDSGSANRLDRLRVKMRPKAKRVFDLSVAVLLIVIIFPIACLIAITILLTGQNPFYSHFRLGRGGRAFGCLKFRSMRRGADVALSELLRRDPVAKLEWETKRKLRNDPRVTRMGRVLRATSVDELPQLLNVVAGQMSLVGPRPVTKDEFVQYYGPLDAAAYCSVRPGLTGLWQVKGRSESGFASRVALDTFYAQRLSLRADLAILLRTIHVVIGRRGAW